MLKSRLAASLVPYVAGEQPKSTERLIKLNTNENPYPPSPEVRKVLSEFDYDKLRLYPDPTATELRKLIAEKEGVKSENIFVGNGSDEVLGFAFAAFFDDHAEPVLFPDITYSFYKVYCSLYGINYEELPLKEDFSIDFSDYYNKQTAGIVITNPNAPTGIGVGADKIEGLIKAYSDKVIIVDEAYVDFSDRGSLVRLCDKYNNVLVVKTFSKSRSLAGARCGYAIGNKELIDTLRTVKNCFNSYPINRMTAAVAQASMSDEAYFKECCERIIKTRDKVAEFLRENGFEVTASETNFLFIKHKRISGKDLQQALREKNIIVRRFDSPRISDRLRVTVGSEEEMSEFMKEISRIIA